jgi:hypothetical protein
LDTTSTLCTRAYAAALFAAVSMLPACSSVPGETMSSGGMQRDVRDRVIAMARAADPQCRQQKIINTEMLEVHPDGKSAEELWTVEQCGRRVDYVVSFPPRRAAGKSLGFSVRPQR